MKKYLMTFIAVTTLFAGAAYAQKKPIVVPQVVKTEFSKKYPTVKKVTWETENGNFEGNWGGKSGEDYTVMYTPAGEFLESTKAIAVSKLPKKVLDYLKEHYKGMKVKEAALVTDAKGVSSYEAEVNKKDVIFDINGNFVKEE